MISTPFSLNKMDVEEIRVAPNRQQIYNPFSEQLFRNTPQTNVSSASKSDFVLGSDQKSTFSQNAPNVSFSVAQKLNFDQVDNSFELNPQVS